ncbi:hypothetical protein [Cupriavidus pauculus]|nr:hypothetical protein [Cupriavidus pauculus]
MLSTLLATLGALAILASIATHLTVRHAPENPAPHRGTAGPR